MILSQMFLWLWEQQLFFKTIYRIHEILIILTLGVTIVVVASEVGMDLQNDMQNQANMGVWGVVDVTFQESLHFHWKCNDFRLRDDPVVSSSTACQRR